MQKIKYFLESFYLFQEKITQINIELQDFQ